MAVDLDVPDGMQAQDTVSSDGSPVIELYTGRFPTQYDATDVRELVAVLQQWLKEKGDA